MLKVSVFNQVHWESKHTLPSHYPLLSQDSAKNISMKGESTFKAVVFLHSLTGLLFPNKIQETEHQRPILSGHI